MTAGPADNLDQKSKQLVSAEQPSAPASSPVLSSPVPASVESAEVTQLANPLRAESEPFEQSE